MNTFLGLLAILALIASNAWFVAAEFGYVAVRRHRLEEAEAAGDASAKRALSVLGRVGFMLSGAQFGITATSLVLGFIAEPVLEQLFRPLFEMIGLAGAARTAVSTTLAFLVAVVAQMVLGELAPKNYAITKPERVALRLARGLNIYMRIFGPIVRLFDGSANALLARFGLHAVEELDSSVTIEELDYIVEAAAEQGNLSQGQARLLSRVLEFRSLTADQVMVPRRKVVTLPDTATGADLMAAARVAYTRFPVVHRSEDGIDEVRGLVSLKQLVGVKPEKRASARVVDLMTAYPTEVVESTSAQEVLERFRQRGSELAVVTDEYGDLSGIVTLEDLVERLLGPIEDEYDLPAVGPELGSVVDDGWRIRGSALVVDVQREFGLELPEGPYDTVGGLVMTLLGSVPAVGEVVVVSGDGGTALELEVESMDHRAAEWIHIRQSDQGAGGIER
ncbi:MAG: HlyC/CorC family transporter [Candidatus Microthrix sp.]|nr:hemolysin family protein [Candidatus Microthrix sp.]MBK6440495.1 HlyC/CorC family transporter [Candidatus Microthrix sp.]